MVPWGGAHNYISQMCLFTHTCNYVYNVCISSVYLGTDGDISAGGQRLPLEETAADRCEVELRKSDRRNSTPRF